MTDGDLTPTESAILIILMAEAREIPNTELKERFHVDISGDTRRKLNGLGYVATRKVGRGNAHVLDDKGWVRVHQDLDFDSPRARGLGGALMALHSNLRDRVLPHTDTGKFGEMFAQASVTFSSTATAEDTGDLGERIRKAYASLASEAGAWVSLVRLRPLFDDVSRQDLDEALRQLYRERDVNLVPESNQKTLTDEQRAAAVHIGAQDKHLLAIGV